MFRNFSVRMQICGQTVVNFLKLPTYCYKPWFIVNRLKVIILKLVEVLNVYYVKWSFNNNFICFERLVFEAGLAWNVKNCLN